MIYGPYGPGIPGAMLYAGGTDALVRLRAGMIDPPALICLERIQELKEIREEAGGLWVGAGASFHQVETSFLVGRSWPLLALAAGVGWFAPYPPHGAPWGGNLGTASPAGDALPALYALGASVQLASSRGRRRLPMAEFITGPGRTALEPGELILGFSLPKNNYNLQHFEKVGARNSLAISIANLAVAASLSLEGEVLDIRLAWGSVGPKVVTSPAAEDRLRGGKLCAAALWEAGELAQKDASPIDDLRAEASYRPGPG